MALSPDLAQLLQKFATMEGPPFHELSPSQARLRFAGFAALHERFGGPPPADVRVTERNIPGPGPQGPKLPNDIASDIPLRIYTPTAGMAPPAGYPGLVFFHGGGWVVGSAAGYDRECREMARRLQCVVVSVDYRLAPEHKFPAAVHDCLAATRWTAAHASELGVNGQRLAVGGDSAGGNLAAVVSQQLRGAMAPGTALVCQLLIYPATDAIGSYPSQREPPVGILRYVDTQWFLSHYLNHLDERTDPRMSPLRQPDLGGLPPAIVAICEYDPLRDEGRAYAEALRAAGVPTELMYFAGQAHGFMNMTALVPSARAASLAILGTLRKILYS